MFSVLRETLLRATSPSPQKLRTRSSRDGATIVLRLLLAEVAFEEGDDLRRVFRHRYVLLHYLGFSIPILLAFLVFNPRAAMHLPHLPSITLGIVAAIIAISAYVLFARWLLQRVTGSNVVLMSPGFLLAAPTLMMTIHFVGIEMGVQGRWTALRSLIMMIGLVIYLEVVGTILLRGPVPRAVARLRAEQKAVRAAFTPSVTLVVAPEKPPMPEPGEDAAPLPAELQDLLRLQAQGNYVLVVSRRGRQLVPGPFSARAAKLPEQLGRRVHRSHWVASQAVAEIRFSGRQCTIKTVDGAKVPVAAGQIAEIRDWAATVAPVNGRKVRQPESRPTTSANPRSGR